MMRILTALLVLGPMFVRDDHQAPKFASSDLLTRHFRGCIL